MIKLYFFKEKKIIFENNDFNVISKKNYNLFTSESIKSKAKNKIRTRVSVKFYNILKKQYILNYIKLLKEIN